jgi:glutathione synthase/RimK-type ligase-like ATP-grasp enzyme
MSDPGDFVMDNDMSIEPLTAMCWQVDIVPWRDSSIDWNAFDAVYISTPWDYPQHIEEFLRVLEMIDNSSATLINSLSLVRWSLSKTYLRDLEEKGAAIVPSMWCDDIDVAKIPMWFDVFKTEALVIKPATGVNAIDTFVLQNPVSAELAEQLSRVFQKRAFMVQPFIENIRDEGEYSLFFFGGEYSHAIQKIPKPGDFRVQEEYGADIRSVEPSQDLLETAQCVLALVEPQPVYVRADLVRDATDGYLLMELEMIEPALYLRMDDGASARFAAAFNQYYEEHSP